MDADSKASVDRNDLENASWGMRLDLRRYEGWAKLGMVFEDQPWKSLGFQASASNHEQESVFGLNTYDADQQNYYANFLYQSIIGNTNHQFKTGASFQYDAFQELVNEGMYQRNEAAPGAFFEYTYSFLETFDIVTGLRADYHSIYGLFFTPRIHLRYAPVENSIFRASMGRGQRTASIFSENNGLLASAREIIVKGNDADLPYGLNPEIAWNYGLNFTQKFNLDYRDGSVSFDLYRTDFIQQIVVDLEDPRKAIFYNLDGPSFSNSFQAQVDYELIKRLDVRLAYRWYDVKTSYASGLQNKPLLASHRAFINLAYASRKYWKFDYTVNWQGAKQIPYTGSNPIEYQRKSSSPSFFVMNAQVSKSWKEKFEVYAGMENILNYKQQNPIIAADAPFGENFDASLIWGPIFGRNTYVGIRYNLK